MELMAIVLFRTITLCVPFFLDAVHSTGDDSYERVKSLQDHLLAEDWYSTTLRPVKNQSRVLYVQVSFSLVAVVGLNDVQQELVTNGFLFLIWRDERNRWNPFDYGGLLRLAPVPKQIWRPRLLLVNTLGDRDPFGDDYSHMFYTADGTMVWVPGGLFRTYCQLRMKKFPFDVQECSIQLCPLSHTNDTIQFIPDKNMNLAFYFPNPGWELVETSVTVVDVYVIRQETFSCPNFNFKLKRRPTTIILNVILPIVFMSLLNNLVFVIPVDSGEKISFAITVLLSLSVFLSMVSTMTPQVSDEVPALTIYLFILFLSSVLTVAAAIITVYIHHEDEKEITSLKSKANFQHAVKKLVNVKRAVAPYDVDEKKSYNVDKVTVYNVGGIATSIEGFDNASVVSSSPQPETESNDKLIPNHPNRFRILSKHMNMVSFIIMIVVWVVTTIWFFTVTATDI